MSVASAVALLREYQHRAGRAVSHPYGRVLQECERWGIRVVQSAPANPRQHSKQADTDTWLEWPARTIYQPQPHALALLHELGHAVCGVDPRKAHEVDDGVIAVEWFGQRRLGLWQPQDESWRQWMATNGIYEPARKGVVRFFEASAAAIEAEMQLCLAGAVRRGVLNADGSPTYALAPVRCRDCERPADEQSGYCRLHDGSMWRRRRA